MEGLEVTEINFSRAFSITGEMRWDSNYYQKHFLENAKLVHSLSTIRFSKVCKFIRKGIFDLHPDNYLNEGIPLIRTSEIKNPTINFSRTVFIAPETNSCHFKTELAPGDLVFTKIGAYIGDVALLPSTYKKYNFSQNVVGASIIDKTDSAYLLVFFLSKNGRSQILRSTMLSGQGKLELEDIRNYEIPIVSNEIKSKLNMVFLRKQRLELNASLKYSHAETLLLDTLGLSNVTNQSEIFNIKSLHDSFGKTGRLDAEYYQKKYEDIEAHITTNPYSKLAQLVKIQKSIEPGSDAYSDSVEGLPFLRVADYNKFGITQPQKNLKNSYVAENYKKLNSLKPKKQTILFSKDGSVGQAYCLQEDADFITSGAILHLTVKNPEQLLPDYLTLVLNSKLVQMQAERDVGGSIILHWRAKEIEEILIPLTNIKTQEKIANLVKESFTLKTESQRLLEVAKHAVEIAIEENEQSAITFLQVEVNEPELVD